VSEDASGRYTDGIDRDTPIGGDCDKHGCKHVAVGYAGAIKVCHDHREWGMRKHRSYQDNGKSTGVDRCADPCGQCAHANAQIDHSDLHGSEAEFWIACPDCDGFWTLTGDLDDLTAHISDDSNEWEDDSQLTGGGA